MSYKAGGRASALYAATGTADVSGQADLATRYVTQLKKQAAQVLGGTIGANLVPIQYNGDLNWYWTDGINFNALTYNYISGAVGPSPAASGTYQVGGAGSFSNLYQELISAIAWQFSAADNATMQQAATQSQTQATRHRASLRRGLRPADGGADAGRAGVQPLHRAADRLHHDVPGRATCGPASRRRRSP